MISPEVYRAVLLEYGRAFLVAETMILAAQLYLISGLILAAESSGDPDRSLRRFRWIMTGNRWLKLSAGTQMLEWALLATVFYPFFFSPISWYWPWALGACMTQVLALLFSISTQPALRKNTRRVLGPALAACVLFQVITIVVFPDFGLAVAIYSPVQAALIALLLAALVESPFVCVSHLPVPVIVIVHDLLLMGGR